MAEETTAALETKADAGKGESGEVKRWLLELQLAEDTEKQWRKDVQEVIKVYRYDRFVDDEREKRKDTFNILWSNVETKRPALYNSMPRPDIRRRYRDKDPLGKAISELMERCVTYTLDCQDFDETIVNSVHDMLLPGRGITRVRYMPFMDDNGEEVAYEEVEYEHVQWDEFHHGPGRVWPDVTWIAFDHKLTREEVEEKFPKFADKVQFDVSVDDKHTKEMDDSDASVFKRCLVHEIWDKEARQIIFIAPSYKDTPIGRKDDKLQLKEFFPIPRPLYAIESSNSLVPMPEYMQYETLAKELEGVTNRIRRILNGLRLRGIYDSTLAEIEKLFDAQDNAFIPAENVSRLIEAGGLDKSIWMLPIETYANILVQLYQYRDSLIQQIYEITGISDIIRGATNPNETLGAQEIKANFGTQRLQRQQRDVQRYIRDLIRLTTEIQSEHFSRQTLSLMSGLNFPTAEEKQRAQQILQFGQHYQQMQQPPPPQYQQMAAQAQEIIQKPSWEEIEQVLHSDMLREFRIDIETDSTIQAELQQDQKNIVELITGITKYFEGIAPVVQSGVMPIEAAKQILMTAVRRFKLGRQVEDALEEMQPPPQQADPEAEKIQAEQQKAQMDAQMEQQKLAMEGQAKEREAALKAREKEMDMALEKRKQDMEYEHERLMAALYECKAFIDLSAKLESMQNSNQEQGKSDSKLVLEITEEVRSLLNPETKPRELTVVRGDDGKVAGIRG